MYLSTDIFDGISDGGKSGVYAGINMCMFGTIHHNLKKQV